MLISTCTHVLSAHLFLLGHKNQLSVVACPVHTAVEVSIFAALLNVENLSLHLYVDQSRKVAKLHDVSIVLWMASLLFMHTCTMSHDSYVQFQPPLPAQ